MLSFMAALDRTVDISRIDATPSSGFYGDQDDVFVNIETDVPARLEIVDTEQWTIWIPEIDSTVRATDRVYVTELDILLDVRRVKPWQSLDGLSNHVELVCVEIQSDREYTSGFRG